MVFQPSRQPKKDYLSRIYGAGKIIGKTLASSKAPSVRERMAKKHGKWSLAFGGKMWMPGRKGVTRASVGKYQSKFLKALSGLKIANKSRRDKFKPGRLGLREEDIRQTAYQGWVQHLGKPKADELIKSQGIDSPYSKYSGGREVRLEEAEKDLFSRTKNLSKEDMYIAREVLRGAAPLSYEETRPERSEFTQEEEIEVGEEIGEEFGSKAQALHEKDWQVEKLSSPGAKESSAAPRSRWRISPFTGWGKKSSGDNIKNL